MDGVGKYRPRSDPEAVEGLITVAVGTSSCSSFSVHTQDLVGKKATNGALTAPIGRAGARLYRSKTNELRGTRCIGISRSCGFHICLSNRSAEYHRSVRISSR